MSNEIYIVRHGQDEDNAHGILNGHRDTPLTKVGSKQAREIATKIEKARIVFDIILSSPLKRVYSTAQAIAENQSAKIEIEPLLIERDFGVMTGKPLASIIELCSPDVLETEHINYFLCPEGAETFPDLVKRGEKLLAELKKKYNDKKILLVTHGDIGKMIYAAYSKKEWRSVLRDFHFGNSEMLILSTEYRRNPHIFKIKQFNKSK